MSLASIVKGGVDAAFNVLKELQEQVTIVTTDADYDPATGVAGSSPSVQCFVIFAGTVKKDGDLLKVGDREMFVKVKDSLNDIRPEMIVRQADGQEYRIVTAEIDATKTVWTCIVRRTQ